MRGVVIGILLGVAGAALWAIEAVRRNAERDRIRAVHWPRPDPRVRSYGEVWDHPNHVDPAAA